MKKGRLVTIAVLALCWAVPWHTSAEDIVWSRVVGASPGKLNAKQKRDVARNLKALKNTHGCQGTLAACLAQGDMTARRHAGFVVRMIQKNKSDGQIAEGLAQRAKSAFPEERFNIDVSDRPVLGSQGAKVTVVEYACFECPFCAHLAPKLKKLQKRYGGKVALHYKYYPVRSHKRGVAAALAGAAAHRQGKFWQLATLMYANRTDLEDDDLLRYAEQAGLDVSRFEADLADKALLRVIEKDKLEGMRYGIEGTPAFFINGKMYQGLPDFAELEDRIAEELDIVEGRI